MKFKSLFAALALLALSSVASASVICNNCAYLNGNPATYLGTHSPLADDNSTFGNSTTGTNGTFSNWWIFDINPAGAASVNAIFLPIANISNFDVQLWTIGASTCAANTATTGGLCTAFGTGVLVADGVTDPAYATVVDFTALAAGRYAFNISGTISGLGPTQPASYTGNLQVQEQAIPEPGTLALAGLSLLGLAVFRKRA